jgi:zinc protease
MTKDVRAQQRRSPRYQREQAHRPDYFKDIRLREDTQAVTKIVLTNGLTILISEVHTTPLAAIVTYVKAGYFDERDEVGGLAHLLEHMFFKGTKKRGPGQIAKSTRALGGVLNARTAYDNTYYYTIVPGEKALDALEIQADALQNPTFDADELKKEALVVIQEGRRKFDNPAAFGLEKLYGLAFEKHPMRRWRIGAEPTLKSITREQLMKFYQDFYRPSNIILSICGDVETEKVVAAVARRYAAMPKGAAPKREVVVEPPQTQLKYSELRGDINQGYIFFGYHTPGINDHDYYALRVLAAMLGEGQGSLLNQRLKERLSLVTAVSAEVRAYKEIGMLDMKVQVDPQNFDKAELGLLTEIEALKDLEISEQDLTRAQALIESDYYTELETIEGRAENLARFEDLGGYKLGDTFVDKIQSVTDDDVRRVLKKYLNVSHLSVLEYLPAGAEPRGYTPESFRSTVTQLLPLAVEPRLAEKPPEIDYRSDLKEPNQAYKFVPKQTMAEIIRPSILRGPEIFIKEDHTLPTITLGIFFPGGKLFETEANSGITELVLRAALKGTQPPPPAKYGRSADFIATQMEMWGGEIKPVVEDDYFGYVLTILSKNIEDGIKLLLEIIHHPKFDTEEVEKEKTALLARIRADKDDNVARPVALFEKALFKNHPYGLPRHGLEPAVKNLKADDIKAWHKARMAKTKPLIAMVGDTQGTTLASFFAKLLQRTESEPAKLPKAKEIKLSAVATENETRGKQQTALAMGFPVFGIVPEDAYALDVLRNMASGLGGRLFQELRDRQSLAYTVSLSVQEGVLGGSLSAYIATAPENETKAMEGLKRELEKLRAQPISREEFNEAQSKTIGSYQIALQSRSALVEKLIKNFLLSRGHEEISGYGSKIKSVTADDVKGVAQRFIDPEHYAIGIVRGKEKPLP